MSVTVLLDALQDLSPTTLSHRVGLLPRLTPSSSGTPLHLELGTQPVLVHTEAMLGGVLHRARLSGFAGGWAVYARHAGSLLAAGIPYVIWEATTFADELRVIPLDELRRSGKGTGMGALLHRALMPVGNRVEGLLYRRAAELYAMSDYTRQRIIATHGVRSADIGILTPPPTRAFLNALAEVRRIDRASANVSAAPQLLFVGRASDPRKNVPLMLAAIARLRDRFPAATLTLVGPYTEDWYRAHADVLGRSGVTLAGKISIEELAHAYSTHDLLVVSSRQEGLGQVVVEALHAGLPVVSTRCGGPEHIINDSGAGILVGHDAEELTRAIASLLADHERRSQLRANALRYARTELSFDNFRRRVLEITRRLVGAGA